MQIAPVVLASLMVKEHIQLLSLLLFVLFDAQRLNADVVSVAFVTSSRCSAQEPEDLAQWAMRTKPAREWTGCAAQLGLYLLLLLRRVLCGGTRFDISAVHVPYFAYIGV